MIGRLIALTIGLICLMIAFILLGGACWGALSMWKAVIGFFVKKKTSRGRLAISINKSIISQGSCRTWGL